jgi:hypothetical protein
MSDLLKREALQAVHEHSFGIPRKIGTSTEQADGNSFRFPSPCMYLAHTL